MDRNSVMGASSESLVRVNQYHNHIQGQESSSAVVIQDRKIFR